MSAGWVAGSVRANALLRRRIGGEEARRIAGQSSLNEAVAGLASGPYGHDVHVGQTLPEVEHGIAATLLWHLRVLAGWQPWAGAQTLRLLAGWFEISNVVEHARALTGQRAVGPLTLGTLSAAWPRLAATASTDELRSALRASPWGDPGDAHPAAVAVGMQANWARRVAAGVPEATAWAAGGLAILMARERFAVGNEMGGPTLRHCEVLLGAAAVRAPTLEAFVAALPASARWTVASVDHPEQLWRAETAWWGRVGEDSRALTRTTGFNRARLVGAVGGLAVDARLVRAAVEMAARGGRPMEAFDAVR